MPTIPVEPRPRSNHVASDFSPQEGVVYMPQYGPCEDGVVTSVGVGVVFVRYKANQITGTATYPQDLFKAARAQSGNSER